QQVGVDLQGRDDHGGGDRPPGASQRDPGVEPAELPGGAGQEVEGRRGDPGGSPEVEIPSGRTFRPDVCAAAVSLRSTAAAHTEERTPMVMVDSNCRW